MDTLKSRFDASITLREILRRPLSMPRFEMAWEAYLALPRGLHASRVYDGVSREKEGHTFAATSEGSAGYAVACYAGWVKSIPPRNGGEIEGGRVQYEHFLLTVGGEPVLLAATRSGYCPDYAVVEGPHAGVVVEYAN